MKNRRRSAWLAGAVVLVAGTTAVAQDEGEAGPMTEVEVTMRPDAERVELPAGEIADAVRERVTAAYLSDEERAALRVEHGLWLGQDLEDPVLHARMAVIAGAFGREAIDNDAAHGVDRAEGLLGRGDPAGALAALGNEQSVRAMRLRGSALEMLGRFDEAIASYEEAFGETGDEPESVRAGMALLRLRGPERDAEAEHRALLDRIGRARDAERLDWRSRLVEAELLYARHNRGDAQKAARDALRLNPRAAGAMWVIARIAVDGFDFDTSEAIAARLDKLADGEADEPRASVYGAQIRALGALRRRDPLGAEAAVDPALARLPEQRDLMALEAAASAAGYRTRSAERLLERLDALSPGSAHGLLAVGRTLSSARQYDLAEDFLRRAIERAPFWSAPRLELGLLLVQAGKDEEARAALSEAVGLDPFDLRAQNSLTLVRELNGYETIETEHFRIRFLEGIDRALAVEMGPVLERIHERVCGDAPGGVDHEPAVKTLIEVMPNHEWFAVRIGGMPSIHTMAASTGPVIAIESPQEGPRFTVGPFDWARVLQHEYTHTVNLSRTRNRVIHWFTEANAVFNEDAPRPMSTWRTLAGAYEAGRLFDLEAVNIAFVRPENPGDRGLAYAQSAWMFEFIVERFGAEAPRTIMDLSAAGRTDTEAFEEALGLSPESFLETFLAWAGEQLRTRGLLSPEDGPTNEEIAAAVLGEDGMPNEEALDELRASHPGHPGLLDVKLGFALRLAQARLTDEQIGLLDEAMRVRPDDDAPHRRLARHYLAGEGFAERVRAIGHLEFLDVREVNSPAYAAELAKLYAETGDRERAFAKANRAATIAPFDADQRELAARMAILSGDMDAAERHLVALTIIEPDRAIHGKRLEALRARM